MNSLKLTGRVGRDLHKLNPKFAVVSLALLTGGCSADVARFDFPSFSLNDSTGGLPRPPEPMRTGGASLVDPDTGYGSNRWQGGAYVPAGRGRDADIQVSQLPAPVPPVAPVEPAGRPAERVAYAAPPRDRQQPVYRPEPTAKGEQIEVQQGDTLYALSRRHGVSLSELMKVNDLTGPTLRPGQKLYLPALGAGGDAIAERPTERAVSHAVTAPSDWNGSYTIKPGDSLYAVARQYNVKQADLQRYNGISEVRRVRPGTVLKVPGVLDRDTSVASNARREPEPASLPPLGSSGGSAPVAATILNSEKRVAALPSGTVTDAPSSVPPATVEPQAKPVQVVTISPGATDTSKLRWPAQGRIIAGFGPKTDGTHNDGINLALPLGTEVRAAEDGTVAYAGSELKGYGNLVLVRHDNGWVTAYAHSDEMLVKRGDKVRRGQVIAKAGKSGQVDQPQLHFELRQGSKPVDPVPYLERL